MLTQKEIDEIKAIRQPIADVIRDRKRVVVQHIIENRATEEEAREAILRADELVTEKGIATQEEVEKVQAVLLPWVGQVATVNMFLERFVVVLATKVGNTPQEVVVKSLKAANTDMVAKGEITQEQSDLAEEYALPFIDWAYNVEQKRAQRV